MERVRLDQYPTPAWCVRRLLETDALPLPGSASGMNRWLDPCAGRGNLIAVVNEWYKSKNKITVPGSTDGVIPAWRSVEIDGFLHRENPYNCLLGDFLRPDTLPSAYTEADVIITNPPYSLAQEFIEASLRCAKIVAMLLRLNFLASETRHAFFEKHGMPDVYVLPNRPSFVGGKTDATEYAWMVWDRQATFNRAGRGLIRILALTPKELRK